MFTPAGDRRRRRSARPSCSSRSRTRIGPDRHRGATCRRHRGRRRCPTRSSQRTDHLLPNTPVSGALAAVPSGGRRTGRSRARRSAGLRRRPVRLADREPATIVRVHWYEGGDAFGARALEIGEDARRDVEQAPRRHRDRAGRLLHLRGPGRLLRRPRAGHPRERRRPGQLRDPDPVRAHPAGRDRRRVGRRSSSRTS